MDKKSMKLKISQNYSFGKLKTKIDDLMNESVKQYAKKTEEGSKQKINRGLRKLQPVTVKIRQHRGQPIRPALKASGKLYNSIKQVDDTLEIVEYGVRHHEGFITGAGSIIPNVEVPARPFISTTLKSKREITKQFTKSVNKSLKK
jgi:phage gpG-like protein